MRLLKILGNTCLISYSVEKAICNMNLSVLQELGDLPVSCMTLKNQRKIPDEMKKCHEFFKSKS